MCLRLFLFILNILFFSKTSFAQIPHQKKSTGLYGFIDGKEHPSPVWVIEPIYDAVAYFQNGLAVVTYKGNKGIINSKGEFVVEPIYDAIRFVRNTEKFYPSYEYFILYKGCVQSLYCKSRGMLYKDKSYSFEGSDATYTVFSEKKKFGLLKKDSLVLPAIHDSIHLSGHPYILVSAKDHKGHTGWKIYQKHTDKWLFKDVFSSVQPISWTALFFVRQKDKTGITDKNGNYIFPLSFDEKTICHLNPENSERTIFVRNHDEFNLYDLNGKKLNDKPYTVDGSIKKNYESESPLSPYWKVKQKNQYGLIDRHGKEVLPCIYDTIKKNSYDEFILVSGKTSKVVDLLLRPIDTLQCYPLCKAKHWVDLDKGYIDITPLRLPGIKLCYIDILVDVFPDSSTILYNARTLERIPKITEFSYEYSSFHGYLLCYHDKIGVLAGDFERAIPPNLDKITGFKMEGKFFTLNKNGRMDIADSTARTVGPLRFHYVYPDHDNYFFFMSKDSLFGIIDHLGNVIVEPTHKTISHYDEKNNCLWLEIAENDWALVDKNENPVLPSSFDYPQLLREFTILSMQGKKGVLGKKLTPIVPFLYYNIKEDSHLFICGKHNDADFHKSLDLYDKKGKRLFTEVENYKRLGDSATAIKIKGEWHFFLNDTIPVKSVKNSPHDLPLQLGLLRNPLDYSHYRDEYSFVASHYLDSVNIYHASINNYLLNRKIQLLSEHTSEEDFWYGEEEKEYKKAYIIYPEDHEDYRYPYNNGYSNLPVYKKLSKESLPEQPYYQSTLTHWERGYSSAPKAALSIKPILNDFFEYIETDDFSYGYQLKNQHVQVINNSLQWLSIGEILADSQYVSILNEILLTKPDKVKRVNYSSNEIIKPIDLVEHISFTSKGLVCMFKDRLVIPYSELIPHFKKSDLLRRLAQQYPPEE